MKNRSELMFKNLSIIVFLAAMISACNNDDDSGGGKTKSMAGASSPVVDFPPPSLSHKRTALVIGNSGYANDIFSRLENPVNDAKDLAKVLAKLGFEDIIVLLDANRQQMNAGIRNFRDKLLINQGVGLFYFSGHGLDYAGKNHLIPLGNKIKADYDIDETDQTIAVSHVLKQMQMAGNHINFLILDACREARKIKVSSSEKGMRAIPDGLNVPELKRGFLTAYAAAPGKAALSGDGERNSPYVKYLMRFIQEPNLSVERMFKKVGRAVFEETQQQEPGYYAQLYDDFSFNPQNVKKKENTFVAGKVFQDRLKDGGFGPEMVMIAGGTFKMGDIQGGGDSDEQPVHDVSVDRFAMGKFEVTVGEFRKFVNDANYKTDAEKEGKCWTYDNGWKNVKGANWRNTKFSQNDNHPVVCVSWNDATAYTKWLSNQTGKTYRLPTEAEWEYAARAGTKKSRYWGNESRYWDNDPDQACYYANVHDNTSKEKNRFSWTYHKCTDGYAQTAPVGSFKPNKFGLYDTLGNVWEWTCSEYEYKYNGKEKQCVTKGNSLSLRGGSWNYFGVGGVRSATRKYWLPSGRYLDLGFRLYMLVTL
jgi:formylglycine-generating enzyme required for sulfatase activity